MDAKHINNVAKQSTSSAAIGYKPGTIAAQGVYPSDNAFLCIICNLKIKNLKAILGHIVGKWHSLKLEKANVNYTKKNGYFSCQLCTNYLAADWQAFLNHCNEKQHFGELNSKESDTNSPNSDFSFSYVTLVKNSVIEYNAGTFFCCCCKELVVGKDLIHRHIDETKHQMLKKSIDGDISIKYECEARKLVKNLVTIVSNSQFYCNLCDCSICGKQMLKKHILGDKHVESIIKTENTDHQTILEKVKPNKTSQIPPPKLTQVELSETFAELMRHNSIIKSSQIDKYLCELCLCPLYRQQSVFQHVSGKRHKSSMEKGANVLKSVTSSDQTSAGSPSNWESTDNSLESWETYEGESQSSESYESSSYSYGSSDDMTDSWETISIQDSSLDSRKSTLFKISSNLMPLISNHFLDHLENEIFCSLCNAHLRSEQCLISHTRSKYHVAELNRHKDQIAKKNKEQSPCSRKNTSVNSSNCQTSQSRKHYGLGTDGLNTAAKKKSGEPTLLDVLQNLVPLISDHMLRYEKKRIYCPACRTRMLSPRIVVEHIRSEDHITKLNDYRATIGMESKGSTYISRRDTFFTNTIGKNKSPNSINIQNKVSPIAQKTSTNKTQAPQSELFRLPSYLIPMLAPHSLQHLRKSVFCQACQLHVRHVKTLREHMTGKKHAARLSIYIAEISSKGGGSRSVKLAKTNSTINSPIHVVNEKSTNVNLSSNQKPITPNPQNLQSSLMDIPKELLPLITIHSLKHLENEIYCVACQVHMTTENSLLDHTSSHSHVARLESFRASSSSGNKNTVASTSLKFNVVGACKELKMMKQYLDETKKVSKNKTGLENSLNKLTITQVKGENSGKLPRNRSKHLMDNLPKNQRSRRQDTRPKQSRPFDPKYLKANMEHIYEINPEKLRIIKLSCQLCFPKTSNSVYCLICEKTVAGNLQNFYEHICGKAHTVYLTEAEQNDKYFVDYPDQFSDLTLAKEFMQDSEEETIQCFACDESFKNEDVLIQEHIEKDLHNQRKQLWNEEMEKIQEDILTEMKSTWYNIQKYWCVFCDIEYNTEFQFAEHIDGKKHNNCLKKIGTFQDRLVHDSCISCAILWLGLPGIYAQHCEHPMHKYLVGTGDFSVCNLPNQAMTLLKNAVLEVNYLIELSDQVLTVQKVKADTLLKCLEDTVKPLFPKVKAYPFGSRVSGLGFPDSDIDVFLDCGTYDGNNTTQGYQEQLIIAVEGCFYANQKSWEVEETLVTTRTPIIKLRHRDTELRCDVSFKNGLSVENTKLLKCFIDNYPLCRKLMLFLKKWLSICNLSGSRYITNYANCWYIIFYLQSKSILPSVATLIAKENKSKLIDGWETGILETFDVDEQRFTFTELLRGFFEFYSEFDFRDSVACPLLGRTTPKQDFTELDLLPKEMTPYINHVTKKSVNGLAELFRIDSEMCIQDPYDLSHNLTKAVRKFTLNRFRRLCATSALVLNNFMEH